MFYSHLSFMLLYFQIVHTVSTMSGYKEDGNQHSSSRLASSQNDPDAQIKFQLKPNNDG